MKHCGQCTLLKVRNSNNESCWTKGVRSKDEPCGRFRSLSDDLIRMENLVKKAASKRTHFDWLKGLNFSQKFIVCVSAGPWKWQRRQTVTKGALKVLGQRDLFELEEDFKYFPLTWQSGLVNKLSAYLRSKNIRMDEFCIQLRSLAMTNSRKARYTFYKACGATKGPKVLALFCRDGLDIPAFPIDRHVDRYLKSGGLPSNENLLVRLCNKLHTEVQATAISFVRHGSGGAIG